MKPVYAITLLACLITACASTEEAAEPEATGADLLLDLSQFDSDEGESCIPLMRMDSLKILSDQAIEFRMKGGDTYINILPRRCLGLRPNRAIMYETRQSQLCNLDIIKVMEPYAGGLQPVGSCGLGRFHLVPEGVPVVGDETEE